MEMRGQDKEIGMPTTLGYNLPNRDSSSKLSSSPTLGETSDQQPPQTHTLIFNDAPQTSHHHHHHLYPPPPHPPCSSLPPNQLHQSQRPRRDPDPNSPPVATTSITSAPTVSGSNPTRTGAAAAAAPPPPPPSQTTAGTITSTSSIRYRECLRNHAASMGSHVVDGCGEFMPSGEEGTPESLRCAACQCHRNFHRKEAEGEPQHVSNYHSYYPNKSNGHNRISSPHLHFPAPHSSSLHLQHRFSHGGVAATPSPAGLIPPMMMAFGGSGSGGPAESSSEDLNMFQSNNAAGVQLSVQPSLSKKRFRTKFTQQQKDRMMEFAEKLGWKIQKHDDQEVQQFCSQVGVKRQVFRVWMHNNKQAMKKKEMQEPS